jgi:Pyruvate flavodoxin/ferredoxin oxidoreductase, thiamine diP-bdg
MLKQIEGSRAVAEAVAMCRPQVICAYPITPQTHIVEALSAMVKEEELKAEFLNVESRPRGLHRGPLPGPGLRRPDPALPGRQRGEPAPAASSRPRPEHQSIDLD